MAAGTNYVCDICGADLSQFIPLFGEDAVKFHASMHRKDIILKQTDLLLGGLRNLVTYYINAHYDGLMSEASDRERARLMVGKSQQLASLEARLEQMAEHIATNYKTKED